jgi:hypothetical protein
MFCLLPALTEAQDEWQGQSQLIHFPLGGQDVIFYSVMVDSLCVNVIEGIAGTGVAIPRLPYPTRIDNQSVLAQFQASSVRKPAGDDLLALGFEHQRHMGMAYQAKVGLETGKVITCRFGRKQVFPDRLSWTAVN